MEALRSNYEVGRIVVVATNEAATESSKENFQVACFWQDNILKAKAKAKVKAKAKAKANAKANANAKVIANANANTNCKTQI